MFFFLPGYYTATTRLGTLKQRIAFVSTYFIPCAITFFSQFSFNHHSLSAYFLTVLAVYTVYEIGYIYNDLELVKREVAPTVRVSAIESAFYEKNKTLIYLVRGGWVLCVLAILRTITPVLFPNIIFTIVIIAVFFTWHNKLRNRYSILLYGVLAFARYLGFILLFINWVDAIWTFFAITLCSIIEFSNKEKYSLHTIPRSITTDQFRVYYLVLLGISCHLLSIPLTMLFYYLLIYRGISLCIAPYYRCLATKRPKFHRHRSIAVHNLGKMSERVTLHETTPDKH